jgi:hypothetical protein
VIWQACLTIHPERERECASIKVTEISVKTSDAAPSKKDWLSRAGPQAGVPEVSGTGRVRRAVPHTDSAPVLTHISTTQSTRQPYRLGTKPLCLKQSFEQQMKSRVHQVPGDRTGDRVSLSHHRMVIHQLSQVLLLPYILGPAVPSTSPLAAQFFRSEEQGNPHASAQERTSLAASHARYSAYSLHLGTERSEEACPYPLSSDNHQNPDTYNM